MATPDMVRTFIAYHIDITRRVWTSVEQLYDGELAENAQDMPSPRWAILFHLVNHGTDHRSTVLQKLHELGAPTFDQDFIFWLWQRA